jgi:hypothetical protein
MSYFGISLGPSQVAMVTVITCGTQWRCYPNLQWVGAKKLIVCILSLAIHSACLGQEATASSCVAKALPLNVKMLTATEVIIDPVSINGVRPPEESWKTCIRRLQGYVTGKVRVNPFQELTIPLDEEGFMTENPKFKTEDMGLNHLAMVFAPAFRRVNRGLFQRFENDRQMILFDQQGIEESANLFLSKEKIWEIVIFHEIGHALGVPPKGASSRDRWPLHQSPPA